jgi:VWFA-related protein
MAHGTPVAWLSDIPLAFGVLRFACMRAATLLVLLAIPLRGQFKSTVPLVVAPVTVTDAKGNFVDGLTERELLVYDNNVTQKIQVDTLNHPISLVVLIEANSASAAILDKLRNSGPLFSDLLAGDAGETAMMAFAEAPKLIQDFTTDSRPLTHALHNLRVQGGAVALLDSVREGLRMLAERDGSRRRVMLVIAERRDRSSKMKFADLLRESQLQNTAIYWLTYSTFLTPFTNRPKRVWDRMTDEEKQDPKRMHSSKYPTKEEEAPLPPDMAPGSLLSVFTESFHKTAPDAATLLADTTSGRVFSFLKQSGLEDAIQAVGREVHRQYIITFQPKTDQSGLFHPLRAEVKDRPDLQVRTRSGYWSIQ